MGLPAYINDHKERYMTGETNESEQQANREKYALLKEFHRTLRQALTGAEYKVFCAIEDWSESKGECWHSQSTIADACDLSVRSVNASVKQLETFGLVETKERTGQSSTYTPAKPTYAKIAYLRDNLRKNCTGGYAKSAHLPTQNLRINVSNINGSNYNDKTTTSVVAAAPPKSSTIDLIETFTFNQEIQTEPSIPTNEVITQPHATYPATTPIDFAPKVKGGSAGVRGEMISSKPRDKPKSKGKGKEPDPNSKHPAVVIWQEIHERFPNKFQMVDIIKAIGEDPGNLEEWRECLIYYAKHPSWDQTNSGRILDCFTNQNYKKGENFGQGGNGKQSFGTVGAGTAQQGARGNGRVLGKSRAFGPDGRLTDEQLQNAW